MHVDAQKPRATPFKMLTKMVSSLEPMGMRVKHIIRAAWVRSRQGVGMWRAGMCVRIVEAFEMRKAL